MGGGGKAKSGEAAPIGPGWCSVSSMTLIIPTNYANTRFIWNVDGIVESLGFSIGCALPAGGSAGSIALAMSAAWESTAIGSDPQWNDEFLYVGTQTTLMTGTGPIVANFTANERGSNAGDALPVNCSVLVSKVTPLGGRKNRGRFNIPSGKVEEAGVNAAGFILPATVTALQNQCNSFYDALVTNEVAPVLFHSDPADAPTDIDAFLVSSQISTQRRRMR